jgi:hypothetical protein
MLPSDMDFALQDENHLVCGSSLFEENIACLRDRLLTVTRKP